MYHRGQHGVEDSDDDEPYISPIRMMQRQRQPVNTFCDKLSNNEIIKDNWQSF